MEICLWRLCSPWNHLHNKFKESICKSIKKWKYACACYVCGLAINMIACYSFFRLFYYCSCLRTLIEFNYLQNVIYFLNLLKGKSFSQRQTLSWMVFIKKWCAALFWESNTVPHHYHYCHLWDDRNFAAANLLLIQLKFVLCVTQSVETIDIDHAAWIAFVRTEICLIISK